MGDQVIMSVDQILSIENLLNNYGFCLTKRERQINDTWWIHSYIKDNKQAGTLERIRVAQNRVIVYKTRNQHSSFNIPKLSEHSTFDISKLEDYLKANYQLVK